MTSMVTLSPHTNRLCWNPELMPADGVYLVGDYGLNETVRVTNALGATAAALLKDLERRCFESLRFSEYSTVAAALRGLRREAALGSEEACASVDFLFGAMQLSEALIGRGFSSFPDSGSSPTGGENTPPLYWMTAERELLVALPPVGNVIQASAMEVRRRREIQDEADDGGREAFLASLEDSAPSHSSLSCFTAPPATRSLENGPNGPGMWMRLGDSLIPGAVRWQGQTFYAHDLLFFELIQGLLAKA